MRATASGCWCSERSTGNVTNLTDNLEPVGSTAFTLGAGFHRAVFTIDDRGRQSSS